MPSRLRTLRARLMAAFTLMIVLTVLFISVPSVLLIDRELTRQVEARLAQGASASRALFDAEIREMRDLVTLTSERPTLRRLLLERDRAALVPYLETIQRSASLDLLSVTDALGQVIAQVPPATRLQVNTPAGLQPEAAFSLRAVADVHRAVALEGSAPILSEDGAVIGYIHETRLLDNAFLDDLRNETGLFHNLLLGDDPLLASVLTPQLLAAPGALPYYVHSLPFLETGAGIVEDVLALPRSEVNQARERLLLLLGGITLLAASGGGLLGFWLARRVTAPLKGLVSASAALGRGDLETPIGVVGGASEVELLSETLERMRKRVREAYQAVDRSNRWHENLLASLTEGVFTVDPAGTLTSFSAGASRILGWSAEEVIGRHISVVLPLPASIPPGSMAPFYPTPGTITRQTTRTRGGEPVTLRITSGERTQIGDEAWEQAFVFRNVTEEEQAARLREFLLANVSHEFKTPLAALHAAVELLSTEGSLLSQGEVEQLIDAIRHGALRLDELVENLIGSAGLQTGHFPVHLLPVDLDELVEEVLLTSRPLLALRGQHLKVDAPSPLRPVHADARRLHQVLINLVSNASKYGPANAPIALAVEERDVETIVRVTDTGAGVPPELRPYLFRPFARQSTPDRNGIGLGLSIVKAIIERHGGRVGFDSAGAGGATFWFTLPAVPAPEAKEMTHEDPARG